MQQPDQTRQAQPAGNGAHSVIWRERKRTTFLGLPLSFTVYTLTPSELEIKSGAFSQKFESIKLFRIVDLTLKRSAMQRVFGLSSIVVSSMDRSTNGEYVLKNIRHGHDIRDMLQDAIDSARNANGVRTREFYENGSVPIDPDDLDGDGIPDIL